MEFIGPSKNVQCMFFKTKQEAEQFARQTKGRSWRKSIRLCPAGFYRGSGWIVKEINGVGQGDKQE